MRFEDAVRLLGDDQSKGVKALDYLLGSALVVAAPLTGGATIGLFDPKNDLVRVLDDVRRRWSARVRGTQNRQRGELLVAAHTVLVVSAYFEAVRDEPRLAGLELTAKEQARIASSVREDPDRHDMVGGLLRMEVPAPGPHRPFDVLMDQIHEHYSQMSRRLRDFARGLAYWDQMHETMREHVAETLVRELPSAALVRYQGHLGQFAAECPEFLFWTNVWEHNATREQVRRAVSADMYDRLDEIVTVLRETRTGLDGLGRLLRRLQPAGTKVPDRWGELAHAYHDDFQRRLFEVTEHRAAAELMVPVLARGYVNPAFRTVEYSPGATPSEEGWWQKYAGPVHEDIQGFLAGYLGSTVATESPLLVLGHPGAGKSVLTRALAAQLGAAGYGPIRVDLRRVPADAPVMDQIEAALRETLHRDVRWDELADTAGDAMPVILLDGFDELLQSSSTSRSDYLERVREFQYVEHRQGRPLAVVVTSRTVVAHRARIPRGATVLRLEPFDESRMSRWLERWNDANVEYFTSLGLRPLELAAVARHARLAEQPLLLMMLALYDADGNALQGEAAELDQADLYERLLTTFVRREVRKTHDGASEDMVRELVEHELNQLSLAAFAMFNRARQFVAEQDLQKDLEALFENPRRRGDGGVVSQALTAAQLLVGRFFFVHVARASFADPATPRREQDEVRTYEFLHATFWEYLVARLAVRAVVDLHMLHDVGRNRLVPTRAEPDDSVLYALLSFQPLTARGQLMTFIVRMARRDPALAGQVRTTLTRLFQDSRRVVPTRRFEDYRPAEAEVPTRIAVYSLNVLLLLLSMSEDGVWIVDLIGREEDATARWRQLALSWWASLDDEAWRSLLDEVSLEYNVDSELTGIALRDRADRPVASSRVGVVDVYRSNAFIRDPMLDLVLTGIAPLASLGDALFRPATPDAEPPVSAVLRMLFDANGYEKTLAALEALPVAERIDLTSLVLRQLAADRRDATNLARVADILERVLDTPALSESVPVLVEVVDCVATFLGRDVLLDRRLREVAVAAARAFADHHARLDDPLRHMRMVLGLDEVRRHVEIPLPLRVEVAVNQVDTAAVARVDPVLARGVLSAAARRDTGEFFATRALGVLEALPGGVLGRFGPREWAHIVASVRSGGAARGRVGHLEDVWRRVRAQAGLPVTG